MGGRDQGLACALAGVLLTAAPTARAGDLLVGVLAHNADLGITVCCAEGGTADVQLGHRTLPIACLRRLRDSRSHLIGEANLSGGVDLATAGLSYRLARGHGFYVAPGMGGALQDGDAHQDQVRPDRLSLGSRLLFEPEPTADWRATDRLSVEFAVAVRIGGRTGQRPPPGAFDRHGGVQDGRRLGVVGRRPDDDRAGRRRVQPARQDDGRRAGSRPTSAARR